jgi:hypothetical protein
VRRLTLLAPVLLLVATATATTRGDEPKLAAIDERAPELTDLRKIWDKGAHNAFTDLVRFQDRWWCVFREATGHVSPDGAVRVLTSTDGRDWTSAARLSSPTDDLRDPKIVVAPDGRLMLCAAGTQRPGERPDSEATAQNKGRLRSLVWFSADGRDWGEPTVVAAPNDWLWRVTWHKGTAFGVAYDGFTTPRRESIGLYQSRDGRNFTPVGGRLLSGPERPNESSLVFLDDPDDTALCLLRRDGPGANALLGVAKPPYETWTWHDLGRNLGGPHMIRIPDGRLIAGGRLRSAKGSYTGLAWVDPQNPKLDEFLHLPSGGDSSYPGLVWHDGRLWLSYYSSHEGKTSIYFGSVKIPLRVKR